MPTIHIPYDLTDRDDARAFISAIWSEALLSSVVDYYSWSRDQQIEGTKSAAPSRLREGLSISLMKHGVLWALSSDAPSEAYPGKQATLTYETPELFRLACHARVLGEGIRNHHTVLASSPAYWQWEVLFAAIEDMMREAGLEDFFRVALDDLAVEGGSQ